MQNAHEIQKQPKKRLISVAEVLSELGIGRTLFYELVSLGRLKTVRIGRRRFVQAEALEAFVANLAP